MKRLDVAADKNVRAPELLRTLGFKKLSWSFALLLACLLPGASPAASTYVSFQEGDLRQGADLATVGTAGTVIDSSYNVGATYLRSDQPTTAQDGNPLLVGNSGAITNRTLLAFNLAYLQTLVGTNLNRLESAALILTHDAAGLGANSTHAVYLTSPFTEATATWNNPHGGNTNAGGFIGIEVRERSCIGTSQSPTKELWGSPAANWSDSGTGPDLMVEAVKAALTNASKTLYLMVKRKSESATDYFSRYQQDGDPDRDYRPELIVGVNPQAAGDPNAGVLAWYYFNENSNTAPSLAAVAAATVPDTSRVWAANAAAGSGLGQFGYGGTTANTHGYGTASFVSAPSGLYVRANATSDVEDGAVASQDYVSFTLGPRPGYVLNCAGLSAWFKLQATNYFNSFLVVRSSLDNFTTNLASATVPGNTTAFTLLTNSLNTALFTNLLNPVEFRFYFYDDTENSGDIIRVDDVGFFGSATNPPLGLQIVTLIASDPSATESGGDPGAFTLQRLGDVSSALAVSYSLSGTATN
ncbi:MAG TPA: DNRLRE domain-containing protein, partial [Candidatus Sulfotelmatobacter sp.]|nr:DNRLRE domain-containing protein [Candidatus Sulfotelmatobacter sp.]